MRTHSRTNSTNADSFRRLEVITGVGRRRRWSDEGKAWIVAESLDPATTVSAVVRRYGLHVSQLFTWRQQLQRNASAAETSGAPGFVPVLMAEDSPAPQGSRPDGDRARPGGGAGRGGRGRHSSTLGARGGAGPEVILVPPGVRILLAAQPVDFRRLPGFLEPALDHSKGGAGWHAAVLGCWRCCFHLVGLDVIARRGGLPCGCKQEFVVRAAFYLLQPYILKR
jgi:transposase